MGRNPNRPQNANLKHFTSNQDKEAASRNGRKGSIASAQAKRKKKALHEIAATIANNPVPDGKAKTVLEKIGVADEDMTCDAMVVAGVYSKACQGDTKAVDKWEEWKGKETDEDVDDHTADILSMQQKYIENINSTFGAAAVYALKHRYTHFDLSGGRGSTKSSFISLTVIRLVMTSPNHDWHALVLRKVGNTLKDSVFSQYQWAIATLGVAHLWSERQNPPGLTYKPTGQRVLFRGADKPLKLKSIKMPFGYIAITHFEEKDQFTGRAEICNILQSTMRGGDVYWNFESYNPPISRDNWANKDSAEERGARYCYRSTYLDLDNPEWLGEQFMNEAEHLKATNLRAYQHEYLGIPVGKGGNVFDNLELRDITDEEMLHFDKIYQGVDWGWFPDPFAFIRAHYDPAQETIYILAERYENKVTNEDGAKWIIDHKFNDVYTICDSAEPKSVADFRSLGVNAKEAVKGPGSIDYGMKWMQKRKIVIDKRRTPHAYDEFVNYKYDKNKDDEWLSSYPDHDNHLIDALRYAMERISKRYGSSA